MEGEYMTFRVHHKGEFYRKKYIGGLVKTYNNFDLDVFSYSELMEWVKALGYTEIGGIYVRKEENSDGWELITDDAGLNEYTRASNASELDLFLDCDVDRNIKAVRQMQPHVIVRPKKSPVKPKEDNPKKRQFVTIKDINQEKKRRMNTSRQKIQSTDKVSKTALTEGKSEYMQRLEIPDVNKKLGEGAGELQHTGQTGLTVYEMQRNKNVEENKRKMKELGIDDLTRKQVPHKKARPEIHSDEEESEYRCPENDLDQESDVEGHTLMSKVYLKYNQV